MYDPWRFMEISTDPVSSELRGYRECDFLIGFGYARLVNSVMYSFSNVFEWLSWSARRDTGLQSKSGCGYEGPAFRVLLEWSG